MEALHTAQFQKRQEQTFHNVTDGQLIAESKATCLLEAKIDQLSVLRAYAPEAHVAKTTYLSSLHDLRTGLSSFKQTQTALVLIKILLKQQGKLTEFQMLPVLDSLHAKVFATHTVISSAASVLMNYFPKNRTENHHISFDGCFSPSTAFDDLTTKLNSLSRALGDLKAAVGNAQKADREKIAEKQMQCWHRLDGILTSLNIEVPLTLRSTVEKYALEIAQANRTLSQSDNNPQDCEQHHAILIGGETKQPNLDEARFRPSLTQAQIAQAAKFDSADIQAPLDTGGSFSTVSPQSSAPSSRSTSPLSSAPSSRSTSPADATQISSKADPSTVPFGSIEEGKSDQATVRAFSSEAKGNTPQSRENSTDSLDSVERLTPTESDDFTPMMVQQVCDDLLEGAWCSYLQQQQQRSDWHAKLEQQLSKHYPPQFQWKFENYKDDEPGKQQITLVSQSSGLFGGEI